MKSGRYICRTTDYFLNWNSFPYCLTLKISEGHERKTWGNALPGRPCTVCSMDRPGGCSKRHTNTVGKYGSTPSGTHCYRIQRSDRGRLYCCTLHFTLAHLTTSQHSVLHTWLCMTPPTTVHYAALHCGEAHYFTAQCTSIHGICTVAPNYTTPHHIECNTSHSFTAQYISIHGICTAAPNYAHTTLHCTVAHLTTSQHTSFPYIISHYTILHDTPLHCTSLQPTTLDYTTLRSIAWHCSAVHSNNRKWCNAKCNTMEPLFKDQPKIQADVALNEGLSLARGSLNWRHEGKDFRKSILKREGLSFLTGSTQTVVYNAVQYNTAMGNTIQMNPDRYRIPDIPVCFWNV